MKRFLSARPVAAAMALLLLGACASGEPPRAELGAADAAIQAAQRSGAAERAPVELNSARVKYEAANAAAREEEYDRAARLAREAELDAQVAAAKAQAETSRDAARQVREGTTTLQRETAPMAPAPVPAPIMPRTPTVQ